MLTSVFFRSAALILCLAFGASALAQTTVTLMDGQNGYVGTRDVRIAAWETTNQGASSYLRLETEGATGGLVKFAIFASEGGPVPDGSTIVSATLSLYKTAAPAAVFKASRLLKNWQETQATWSLAASGVSWTSAGAMSAGNDYLATADGQGSVGAADGWLNINVTTGVQALVNCGP